MTVTISNGQAGTQNVIFYMKSIFDKAFMEYCVIDGTTSSVTHNVPRESLAIMIRRSKDAGLTVKLYKDFT